MTACDAVEAESGPQYSPLRGGGKLLAEEEFSYVEGETPGRPEREASCSGRDERVGCLVVLETGTCVCCHEAGGLENVDVGAMSRLLVALRGFSQRFLALPVPRPSRAATLTPTLCSLSPLCAVRLQ